MSTLNVGTLQATNGVSIEIPKPHSLYSTGHVIQTVYNVSQERHYYTVPQTDSKNTFYSGACIVLEPMTIEITPKSPDSLIYVEFCLYYETHHDTVFVVTRDNNILGTNWAWGTSIGTWNGVAVSRYDNNQDSTPSYLTMPWVDRAGTTEPIRYSVGVRYASRSTNSIILNGTYSNYQFGADAYEQGVSFSIAQEIGV